MGYVNLDAGFQKKFACEQIFLKLPLDLPSFNQCTSCANWPESQFMDVRKILFCKRLRHIVEILARNSPNRPQVDYVILTTWIREGVVELWALSRRPARGCFGLMRSCGQSHQFRYPERG